MKKLSEEQVRELTEIVSRVEQKLREKKLYKRLIINSLIKEKIIKREETNKYLFLPKDMPREEREFIAYYSIYREISKESVFSNSAVLDYINMEDGPFKNEYDNLVERTIVRGGNNLDTFIGEYATHSIEKGKLPRLIYRAVGFLLTRKISRVSAFIKDKRQKIRENLKGRLITEICLVLDSNKSSETENIAVSFGYRGEESLGVREMDAIARASDYILDKIELLSFRNVSLSDGNLTEEEKEILSCYKDEYNYFVRSLSGEESQIEKEMEIKERDLTYIGLRYTKFFAFADANYQLRNKTRKEDLNVRREFISK